MALKIQAARTETRSVAARPRKKLGRKTKVALWAIFLLSSFLFFCLVMLNYYENCSITNCAKVHAYLGWFDWFDYKYIIPSIKWIPIPLPLGLIIPCSFLFGLMLLPIIWLRISHGARQALLEGYFSGLLVILMYESGIRFLAPDWWRSQFSNIAEGTPFVSVTNEIIFYEALIQFIVAGIPMLYYVMLGGLLSTETQK